MGKPPQHYELSTGASLLRIASTLDALDVSLAIASSSGSNRVIDPCSTAEQAGSAALRSPTSEAEHLEREMVGLGSRSKEPTSLPCELRTRRAEIRLRSSSSAYAGAIEPHAKLLGQRLDIHRSWIHGAAGQQRSPQAAAGGGAGSRPRVLSAPEGVTCRRMIASAGTVWKNS
jgi:hypothetical protein